jgi:hypothetical protein
MILKYSKSSFGFLFILSERELKIKLFIFYFFLFHHFLKVFTQIENQLKTMEEDMMYKAESDSTVIYKEIKKAIFDLKKGKSAGPDRILNEVIKYNSFVIIGFIFIS